jgi:hypothetical protein
MGDLTNSINEGRNDWEKMKFTQPPEEKGPSPEDVRNSGHSTMPSDVSPNAGGGERTIAKKHARWEDTLAQFVNSPENKELRKKLDPKGFNDLKNSLRAIVRRFTMFLADKVSEGQPVDIVSELADTVPQLEDEKSVALKKAQLAVDAFNKQIRDYKQGRKTVGMDFTEIPKAKSPEEFQDFLNSASKTGDHVIDYFLNGVTGKPMKKVVARDVPGSGHGGSNVRPVDGEGNVQRDLNVLFSTIQNNPEALNHFNKLLAAIYFFYGEASRLDGSILGLKEKIQRIAASRKSREKRVTSAPIDMNDFRELVNNNLPEPEAAEAAKQIIDAARDAGNEKAAQEMEQEIMKKRTNDVDPGASSDDGSLAPVNESAKAGPGKVFAPKSDIEEKKSIEDIYKNKKQSLNESWKKYSEKNKDAKNGEEPEGFSIVMG